MMNYLFSLIYTPESVADWFALKIIDLNANQQLLLQNRLHYLHGHVVLTLE